jgi:hypothetical protein
MESRPLALGVATASFVAFAGLVAFDLAGGGGNPAIRAAVVSIDPALAGGAPAGTPAPVAASAPRTPVRAGLLVPGELLLETSREAPRGDLFLNDAPVRYPAVLDSVPAGRHALRLVEGGRTVWVADVSLEPGGVERIVVPDAAAAEDSTADTTRTPTPES